MIKPTYFLVSLALLAACMPTCGEWVWNGTGGSIYDEAQWIPAPPAGSIDPASPVADDLFVPSGSGTFDADLHLGTRRLRVAGGSVVGSAAGISADGNASDIRCGLVLEGGTVDADFLEDVICGLSGNAQLVLRDADPLRDSFVELASPECSVRFAGMGKADARTIANLRCSLFGLQAVEGKNYRLVTSGSDTILEPYAWVWTGAGDGVSLYQGANWDTDPDTAGTQPGTSFSSNKRLPATLFVDFGGVGGGSGFGTNLNLYRYSIYLTGGTLKGNTGGGIVGGVNARNDRNPIHVMGGKLEAEWLSAVELHLGGTGRAVLRGADEALDNVVVVLRGTGASMEFEEAEYLQVIENYLPMIDTDAGPAVAGSNVCLSPLPGGGYRLKRIADGDGDGMDDTWETDWTGSTAATGAENTDGDSLNLLGEFQAGTRPDTPDTDGDGLDDGAEATSNPLKFDTDNDGLGDGDETATNPALADSDGDGFKDGGELRRGTDPQDHGDRPDAPNIILVMVDDMGWGEPGAYGNTTIQTPSMDAMAAAGLRFTDAYTNGCVCAPTRYSLMVGRHTGRAELRSWNVRMREGDISLASMMRDAGYHTGLFGKWGIGDAGNGGMPTQVGFDDFFGIVDHQEGHRHYHRYLWRNEQRVFYNHFTALEHGGTALDVAGAGNNGMMSGDLESNRGNAHSHDLITKEVFDWITTHKDDAFFVCWHPIHPHGPLQESAHPGDLTDGDGVLADTSQRSMIDHHYAGTSLTDNQKIRASQTSANDYDIGRLTTLLTTLGIADNTMVIVTSDNGPDQNWANDSDLQCAGDLRGHKWNFYEGGFRVPFIAWGKGVPVGVSGVPVSLDDLMPTIAEIAGASPNPLTSGRSIRTLLDGSASTLPTRPLYWEWSTGGNWIRVVRYGDWKLHRFRSTSTPVTETRALYHLATDPGETTDVSGANPSVLARLERIMDDPFYHDVGFENFRATDEFHAIDGDGSVAKGSIGPILDDGMTAWTPLADDLAASARFAVRFKLDPGEIGSFELTDESGALFVGFSVDRSGSLVTLVSGPDSISGSLPAADADGAWSAWVDWVPGGTCSLTIGDLLLQRPAPAGLTAITRVRHRSLAGTAEFSSFRLHLTGIGVGGSIEVDGSGDGVIWHQTRPTHPGGSWQHFRSDTLMPGSWMPAEVLRERRQLVYGAIEEAEVVFPFQESTDPDAPLRRFYRSVLTN